MGLFDAIFGGDSSSSSSSTSTSTTNASSGASEGALSIAATGPVTLTEPGAIKAALDLAGEVNRRALEALTKSFSENVKAIQSSTDTVLQKQSIDSGERLQSTLTTLGWISGAVVLGLYMVKRYA